jgi:hypothetical protein
MSVDTSAFRRVVYAGSADSEQYRRKSRGAFAAVAADSGLSGAPTNVPPGRRTRRVNGQASPTKSGGCCPSVRVQAAHKRADVANRKVGSVEL